MKKKTAWIILGIIMLASSVYQLINVIGGGSTEDKIRVYDVKSTGYAIEGKVDNLTNKTIAEIEITVICKRRTGETESHKISVKNIGPNDTASFSGARDEWFSVAVDKVKIK